MTLTLFEGPVLALILAVALRTHEHGKEYLFGTNPNIPVYMFICTIVALFLGLIVSADEIIQDKKILKRESFLKLSRNSYLLSKVFFLFLVSAVQCLLFLLIGNTILGFNGLFFDYWLVLFSVSCFGNLLGLNISSALKTRVAVYILIPFLIIPQIMLSGVMVKFEELNPLVSNQSQVPMIGNIMASRWAYEGLAVDQFKNNNFESHYFDIDQKISNTNYRTGYWADPVMEEIDKAEHLLSAPNPPKDSVISAEAFLKSEINTLKSEYPEMNLAKIEQLDLSTSKQQFLALCRLDMDSVRKYLNREFVIASDTRERMDRKMIQSAGSMPDFNRNKRVYCNEKLEEMVKNEMAKEKVVVANNKVIRRYEPVYIKSQGKWLFCAPFYCYSKSLFGIQMETIWFNAIIIWCMTATLYVFLYYDWLKKLIGRKVTLKLNKLKRQVNQ